MHPFNVVTSVFSTGDGFLKVIQAAVPSITMWYTIRMMTMPLGELRLKTATTSSFGLRSGDKEWLHFDWLRLATFSGWRLCLYLWLYLTRIPSLLALVAIIHWSDKKSIKTQDFTSMLFYYWTVWFICSGTKFMWEGKTFFVLRYIIFLITCCIRQIEIFGTVKAKDNLGKRDQLPDK